MRRDEQIVEASRRYAKAYQKPFVDGALWADRTMIDKACEWLEENMPNKFEDVLNYVDNFRKAMKGGER